MRVHPVNVRVSPSPARLWFTDATAAWQRYGGRTVRYFRPDIQLGSALGVQVAAQDKLGGLPWGLPLERWPRCASCNKPQSLLAELHHSPPRLDLGAPGRVLFVFHCCHNPGLCEDWAHSSGCNAALVVDAQDLQPELTPCPSPAPPTYVEVRVVSWEELDDGLPPELATAFQSDNEYLALDEATTNMVTTGTRLGSVPAWIQSPDEAPSGFRFVGQLDSTYSFYCPFPSFWKRRNLQCWPDKEVYEGRTWYMEGPNFGDGGIGYIFVRDAEGRPDARFFWQCL